MEMKPVGAGNAESKKQPKMRPPMRSSIACTRCRKSKIKCENTNGASPCDNCIKTGNQCVFKVPDTIPPKRSEPPVVVKQERDGGSDRKRLKKIDDISKSDNHRATILVEDVLSASFLTEDLWEQVLDLYKLHFAPELPFLHLPTMKERLGRRSQTSNSEHGSDTNIVLLGVLTLTARLHPDLVRYTAHICNSQSGNARTRPLHSQPDPAAASEYYADILSVALGPVRTTMSTASVDRVAALLMLGLYEWSQTQPKTGGMTAWMYVGTAIRMAQFLGLGFEDAKEPGDTKFGAADLRLKDAGCESQFALQREVKRRVMFSCFILDRMLACGKHRASIIRGEDLDIQLPCSEDKFDLAMEVHTGRLSHMERNGSDDSVLSRFIQLVNLWGEISKYSSQGGRVEDKHPPWHPESDFYKLNKALDTFDYSLPGTFTFSRSNYFKHENHQASSAFVLLHMLRFVSLIMLHREYVPFVPIRCREPEGPLDQPTFTREETPAGFWRTSAEQLFKAARGIVDLTEICEKKNKLPQSTIVLFAIWTAAFVGLYATHFPQMDTESHMIKLDCKDTSEDGMQGVFKRGCTAVPFRTLLKMSTWQKMATTYVDILHGMNEYFDTIKKDYYRYSDKDGRPNKTTHRVREGGMGGGLEEYRPLVGKLKDFGSLQPDQHDVLEISERLRVRNLNRLPNDIDVAGICRSAPPASFTAINHGAAIPAPEPARPTSRAAASTEAPQEQLGSYVEHWRYHDTHQQQTQHQQTQHQQTQHQQTQHQQTLQQQTHSPVSQPYPTPGSILDSGPTRAPTYEAGMMNECDTFWDKLQREELRRFGATGDLSLFSTGQSEVPVAEMPFGGSSYTPIISEPSYQLLQQARDYQAQADS
ncbi:putative fungal specific transcription factor [Rosellinia necatrix]|uniref:Putative fungal specific transcription factor n=1 Tax=Rosellinia necatrix TaxID=77044 RepID=A0A1S7UKH2_ROSNE|nr:putative fungal specific transcription factor [Rosellinia necatrix]